MANGTAPTLSPTVIMVFASIISALLAAVCGLVTWQQVELSNYRTNSEAERKELLKHALKAATNAEEAKKVAESTKAAVDSTKVTAESTKVTVEGTQKVAEATKNSVAEVKKAVDASKDP